MVRTHPMTYWLLVKLKMVGCILAYNNIETFISMYDYLCSPPGVTALWNCMVMFYSLDLRPIEKQL
jgi:hypothetical protein